MSVEGVDSFESFSPFDLTGKTCVDCKTEEATALFCCCTLSATHGLGEPICERCEVKRQIKFAKEKIKALPGFERKLAQLEGRLGLEEA